MGKNEVQYYSHHANELKYSQQHKIQKFLENDCIKYSEGAFICEPIKGYNTRTYVMVKDINGDFLCNCQGFQTALKKTGRGTCSHVGALYESFARRKKVTE